MPAHIRFGPFELDISTAELTRNGRRVRLPEQQFQILQMLLDAQGELVPRDEIRKRLWPDNTMVEFDQSINSAIKKLRASLGDSADSPRYIETIARRGYRIRSQVQPPNESQGSDIRPVTEPDEMQAVRVEEPRTKFNKRRWLTILGSAVVVLIGMGCLWYVRPLTPPHVGNIVPIVQNLSGQDRYLLGTDGQYLYVADYSGPCPGKPTPTMVAIGLHRSDAKTIPLNLPWHHDACTFLGSSSPDGAYLLVGESDGAADVRTEWLFSVSGTPIRNLSGLSSARDATWTPDGKSIIYSSLDGSIYSLPIEGGDPRMIASKFLSRDSGPAGELSMSPDGRRIRFLRDDGVWQISAEGSTPQKVAKKIPGMIRGQWTPDGAFYLIFAESTLDTAQIWAQDERRSFFRRSLPDPIQLTSEPVEWVPPAVISKDGRTIYARGIIKQGELVRFEKKSGQFRRFLNGISAEWLEFSPDAKYVAYVSFPDRKVWRARSDGTQKILLAEQKGQAYGVRWSPDGTKILFGSWLFDQSREEIFIVPSDGGNPVKVPLPDAFYTSDPTWSPDGNRLAYSATADHGMSPNEIRIYDLAAKKDSPLPKPPRPLRGPRWSPDGRYIFCLSYETDLRTSALIFDFETKKWLLFPHALEMHYANWSRDSRSVYFIQTVQPRGIYRMLIPSGTVEQIADLKDYKITGAFGDTWLGLDPQDTPLVLHDIRSDQIYSIPFEHE